MAAQGSWQMRKVSCGPPQAADLTPAMAWGSRCHLGGLGCSLWELLQRHFRCWEAGGEQVPGLQLHRGV